MPRSITKSALTKKSQITLPVKVREVLKVQPGDQVTFKIADGLVQILPIPSLLDENFGKIKAKRKPENFRKIRAVFQKRVGEEVSEEH